MLFDKWHEDVETNRWLFFMIIHGVIFRPELQRFWISQWKWEFDRNKRYWIECVTFDFMPQFALLFGPIFSWFFASNVLLDGMKKKRCGKAKNEKHLWDDLILLIHLSPLRMIKGESSGLYGKYDYIHPHLILAKLVSITSLHLNAYDKSYDAKWQLGEKKV